MSATALVGIGPERIGIVGIVISHGCKPDSPHATVKPPRPVSGRTGRLPRPPSTNFNTWRAPVTMFCRPPIQTIYVPVGIVRIVADCVGRFRHRLPPSAQACRSHPHPRSKTMPSVPGPVRSSGGRGRVDDVFEAILSRRDVAIVRIGQHAAAVGEVNQIAVLAAVGDQWPFPPGMVPSNHCPEVAYVELNGIHDAVDIAAGFRPYLRVAASRGKPSRGS